MSFGSENDETPRRRPYDPVPCEHGCCSVEVCAWAEDCSRHTARHSLEQMIAQLQDTA